MADRLRHTLALLATTALLAACVPKGAQTLVVEPWPLPASANSSQPDLSFVAPTQLALSWVDKGATTQQLRMSHFLNGEWMPVLHIADSDYFGSEIDTPHVRVYGSSHWAQWLRKSPAGGHARDVVLSQSRDAGASWSQAQLLNLDGTPTEHGFVAMWPAGADGPATTGSEGLGIAWLDGRTPGQTMVRAARFDGALARSGEAAVDTRSCDCCQTDAVVTKRGVLLAYRDRSPGEVRDIVVARHLDGRWLEPRTVHADGWVMAACPINGPAIAAVADRVAVAWFTGAGDAPSVRLALSQDVGDSFGPPLVLAHGGGVLGHVDVAIDSSAAWVVWAEQGGHGQSLQLARVSLLDGKVQRAELASVHGSGRDSGIPKAVRLGDKVYVVWTDVEGGTPKLKGAVASLR